MNYKTVSPKTPCYPRWLFLRSLPLFGIPRGCRNSQSYDANFASPTAEWYIIPGKPQNLKENYASETKTFSSPPLKSVSKNFLLSVLEIPKTKLKIQKLSSKIWQYHVFVGVNVGLSSLPNKNIFAPQNYYAARYLSKD